MRLVLRLKAGEEGLQLLRQMNNCCVHLNLALEKKGISNYLYFCKFYRNLIFFRLA
jgi:hypothetical protein